MLNKRARIQQDRQMYYACRAVLRIKYGSHAVPKTHRCMEKDAFNFVGAALGGATGGYAGYQGGNWLANKFGLKQDDWRAKALRWGGAALGGVGGAALGNFVGPYAGKALSWAGRGLVGLAKNPNTWKTGFSMLSSAAKAGTADQNQQQQQAQQQQQQQQPIVIQNQLPAYGYGGGAPQGGGMPQAPQTNTLAGNMQSYYNSLGSKPAGSMF